MKRCPQAKLGTREDVLDRAESEEKPEVVLGERVIVDERSRDGGILEEEGDVNSEGVLE